MTRALRLVLCERTFWRFLACSPGLAICGIPMQMMWKQVLPHLCRAKYSGAETHFVVADSGKVLCIDFGYPTGESVAPGKRHPSNRRPLLHSMAGLYKHTGADRIDTVFVSHFHDDHVNGINLLRRLYGTQVWAADLFADLLEQPMKYDWPCLWHETIPVACRLPLHESFKWEGITFTLTPCRDIRAPFRCSPSGMTKFVGGAEAFDDLHRKLMIVGDEEAHFGAESQGGKLQPYRVHLPSGGEVELQG